MKWKIEGRDNSTKQLRRVIVNAPDEQQAVNIAFKNGITADTITEAEPAPIAVAIAAPATTNPPHISQYATPMPAMYGPPQPKIVGVSGFGIASLVLGIISLLTAWVPIVGLFVMPLALIGGLLGIIGIIVSVTGKRSGVGLPVAGTSCCALAVVLFVLVTSVFVAGVDQAIKQGAQQQQRQQQPKQLKPQPQKFFQN